MGASVIGTSLTCDWMPLWTS